MHAGQTGLGQLCGALIKADSHCQGAPHPKVCQSVCKSLLPEGDLVQTMPGCVYYPPEVGSMKYCCLGVFTMEYFRLVSN